MTRFLCAQKCKVAQQIIFQTRQRVGSVVECVGWAESQDGQVIVCRLPRAGRRVADCECCRGARGCWLDPSQCCDGRPGYLDTARE